MSTNSSPVPTLDKATLARITNETGAEPTVTFRFADNVLGVDAKAVHRMIGGGPMDAAHVCRAYAFTDAASASLLTDARANGTPGVDRISRLRKTVKAGVDGQTGLQHRWTPQGHATLRAQPATTKVAVVGKVYGDVMGLTPAKRKAVEKSAYDTADTVLAMRLKKNEQALEDAQAVLKSRKSAKDWYGKKDAVAQAQADVDAAQDAVDDTQDAIADAKERRPMTWPISA